MILSNEIIVDISQEIEDGLPIKYACDLFSVTQARFGYWMNQGLVDFEAEVDSLYALLYVSVKKAYAKYIKHCKNRICGGEVGWQATAWWLERTNKDFQMNNESPVYTENININTRMKKK